MELTSVSTANIVQQSYLLQHWLGHRKLTRKLIEVFPEKEFFEFSIGGMRPFAKLVEEMLAIAVPGLRQIVTGNPEEFKEHFDHNNSKDSMLALWDQATTDIEKYWPLIPAERFNEEVVTFGLYPGTVLSSILYFIDNEIHHRGQAYVYLRALGVEPPKFWERY